MQPQRPPGSPPPRSVGKPRGSPPPKSPLGKPPGPPPGPPPGTHVSGPIKPPPRDPPPAAEASHDVGPSRPSTSVLPPSAESKAPAPAPAAVPPTKAPPPPRVGSSPVSPPPEDEKKISRATVGQTSPRPPPGQPPKSPTRTVAPGEKIPSPARPPLRAPTGASTEPLSGTLPDFATKQQASEGAEISTVQSSAIRVEGIVAPSRAGTIDGILEEQLKTGKGVVKGKGVMEGEGWTSYRPESLEAPKSPPPSPKVPPGLPMGMAPPTTPPSAKSLATSKPRVEGKFEMNEEAGTGGLVQSLLGQSPPVTPTLARQSPPGRRPPHGLPPGKRSSPPSPSVARPSPPPVEELSVVISKEEEEITIADEMEKPQEEDAEEPPNLMQKLPPPESLSDGCDDESDKSAELLADEPNPTQPCTDQAKGVNLAAIEAVAHEGKELEVVRPGRFTVRCIAGGDVKKSALSSKKSTVDAYLHLTLGKHEKAPGKRSQVVKRSGVSPDFRSEKIVFNIVEPTEFIVGGDVTLAIELRDDNARSDGLLAAIQLSALRFLHPDAVPEEIWFTLEAPSARKKDRMKVLVEISFEPALVGMFVLTLFEGRGLGEADPVAKPNPYIVVTLGETYQKRSSVAKGGGSTPFFREEDILLWVDRENWTNDLQIQVRSEDIGTDAELGAATMSVLPAIAMPPDKPAEHIIELSLGGEPSGSLLVKSVFLPAGKLTLECKTGRGLKETSADGRMDPYVTFRTDGQTMEFDIVDQYNICVDCFNHDLLESDVLVGSAQWSLLPAFKRGTMDAWIPLTAPNGFGPPNEAGEIHCVFSFVGPPGLAYPQHQPGVDSFDDSLRVNLRGYLKETDEDEQKDGRAGEKGIETSGAIVRSYGRDTLQGSPGRSLEFTDDEIAAAFKFLDLDRNLHIGAAEIRHILTYMGELITDEEVDMMVSMVDADGDGQVNYKEFHRLVIDPDPSRSDFGTDLVKTEPKELGSVAAQEMKDRENKKLLLEVFVKENEIRGIELELAYRQFRMISPANTDIGGPPSSMEIDFDTWMTIFDVEGTGQYRKLFEMYTITQGLEEGNKKVDIREILLGMGSFVEWPLEQRSRFIFTLFDEDQSGFISMDELVQVLKANHISSAKTVAKKAQTIMRQVDGGSSGKLTAEEFLVVAKKFPNLLFPAMKQSNMARTSFPQFGNG